MLGPFRYCTHIKHMNHASLAFNSNSLGQVIAGLASRFNYSQDKGGCCKDIAQTAGKKVEPWPKSEPPPPQPWRAECSQEPQPPNYDPYRIKVPDVVVPPLPPSNVKRTGVVYTTTDQHGQNQDPSFHRHQQPTGFQSGVDPQVVEDEETKDPSFLGRLKGFFGKLKGKQGKEGEGNAMMKHCRDIHWIHH